MPRSFAKMLTGTTRFGAAAQDIDATTETPPVFGVVSSSAKDITFPWTGVGPVVAAGI